MGEDKLMSATLISFPTTRKRPYKNPYVSRDALPAGVERLPKPGPYANLRRTPELALLCAILSSMEMPIRWRIAKEVELLAKAQEPGGYMDDLARLLMDLPCHIEEKR